MPRRKRPPRGGGPKELGKYDDWIAATYEQGGQMVCYAFTRAKSTQPEGASSTSPLLTVTDRPGSRDEVAITAPFTYPKGASVTVQVNQTGLDFYTAGRDAFARDGKVAVGALTHGEQAVARGPGPHEAKLVDAYSLKGFTAAHEAIVKACPAK